MDGTFGPAIPHARFNSVGLFLYQCKLAGDSQLAAQIQNFQSKIVTSLPADLSAIPGPAMPTLPTVVDTLGTPDPICTPKL